MRLKGKYLLPFRSSIEGLESLLTQPVDVVVVMSRTFVDRIKNNLKKRGYKGTVLIIKELI
jgi:broad-specificity NMP kinase